MDKTQAFNELDFAQKLHEQNILLKISKNIISTLNYESVLQIISDGMSELLEIETAAIYLLENEEDLYLGATTPPLDPNMPNELRFAKINDHPHIKNTITFKKPQVIFDSNTEKLSPSEQVIVELRRLRSLLFFPFIEGKNVLGVLILGTSNKSRTFSKQEIDLGETVANQLSIGIQNAMLHEDLLFKNKQLVEEINERKKAEIALRNSEAHLSNALKIAKLGHWEYDVKNDLFTFTDEFYEIFKTSVNKIGGYTMNSQTYANNFVAKQDKAIVHKEIQKAINANEDNFSEEIEHRFVYADGSLGYLQVRYKTLKENGEIVKLVGANQDITERKLAEEELKSHRDNLEQLVKEKTIELDASIEELRSINEELKNKNRIINQQNEELIATLQNLKETQSKLIQAEKMASLGILTSGVAHEINNPLNYIMGSYLALEKYLREQDSIDQDYTTKILSSLKIGLDKATIIVQGLNQFSRDIKAKDEDCNINEILDNCLMMINNQITHRIKVAKNYSNKKLLLKGNIGQLHQAFLNIFTNTVHAIKDKGEIKIITKESNNKIIIEIIDNGIGISKANLPKVTDPFFTTKEPGKGTGLGLSISYTIFNEHKGSIEFESEINKGTKVKVSFSKR